MEAPTLPEFVFEPAAPYSWSWAAYENANHEAAHSVIACLLGIKVLEARIDMPDVDTYGHIQVVVHPDDWSMAAAYVAPLVRDGTAPPTDDLLAPLGSDLYKASSYWRAANRQGWPELLEYVRWLLLSPASRRGLRAVSSALLAEGAIPGHRVEELVREATGGT